MSPPATADAHPSPARVAAASPAAHASPAARPVPSPVRRDNFSHLEAESVLGARGAGPTLEYRVKWAGFSSKASATWELAAQLRGVRGFADALARFTLAMAARSPPVA